MEYSSTILLIRHLPSDLSDEDKTSFLQHFGAKAVRVMGNYGPMKHTAFASFESAETAEKCLQRLHQIDVLGHKLIVEYAKAKHNINFPHTSEKPKSETDEKDARKTESSKSAEKPVKINSSGDAAFQKHGLEYPRKPNLYYLYPPPTVSTLTNIANALASHPGFYTQVLHLMNKMNLPCPFGAVTASPPLAMETQRQENSKELREMIGGDIDEIQMEQESTEESEIESDDETKGRTEAGKGADGVAIVKKGLKRPRKKMKLIQPDTSTIIKPSIMTNPKEVFENTEMKSKQITLNISASTPLTGTQGQENAINSGDRGDARFEPEEKNDAVTVVEGGFGKVEPQAKPKQIEVQKTDVNYNIDPKEFLDQKEVASGRLKVSQFKDFSVFKKYTPGECTSRLYIKNLTKHTTEQELVNLFGSFINWSVPLAYDTFDIRVMKEGRMKGQAFVTLPDEASAQAVVNECNGFIMNNKPMVIQFARSAKAKEVDKPVTDD